MNKAIGLVSAAAAGAGVMYLCDPDHGCSPATRLMAGIAGSAMTVYGGKRRGVLGAIIGSVGLGMLAQALTNVETRRLLGCETDNVPPRVVGETETMRPAQAA